MWFLNRMLHIDDYEDDIEEEEEESGNSLALHVGMSVDVFTQDSTLALSGDIITITDNDIVLERTPGCLSFVVLELNEKVSIRGYDSDMRPFCYVGAVRNSSRTRCEIRDLDGHYVKERRQSFRIKVDHPSALSLSDKNEDAEQCMLLNISTGGACVRSEFLHREDDVIYLQSSFGDTEVYTRAQIIRVMETPDMPGVYDYGILFPSLDDNGLSEFTGILYKVQSFLRKNMR